MKMLSLIISVAAVLLVGGQSFAGLDNLEAEIERRQDALERRKVAIEKQTEDLKKCKALGRIPKILNEFSAGDCPENLTHTSKYLSEFTSQFIETQLYKPNPEAGSKQDLKDQNCSICMDHVEGDENSFSMGCGHLYHLECIQPGLQSYLDQEQSENLISCKEKGCFYKLSPGELAQLTTDSDQALAIQRMFVRSVDVLKFCPNCGDGIAKHNGLLEFGYHCQTCDRDLCFSCGRPPHHDVTCEELNTNEGVKKAFIREILKAGQSNSYGLCPNCSALIEKTDGCSSMTCGQNASDKTQIPGSIKGRGCGNKFDWNTRVRLENATSGGQASGSGSREIPNQTQDQPMQPVAGGLAPRFEDQAIRTQPALTLDELREQAGIIRVEADDPRVRDFPEFVALGEMYEIRELNLILSGRAPQTMNYGNANAFCTNLDGPRNLLRMRQPGGARVPTDNEWRRIGEIMGRGTPRGYNPNLISDMNHSFWSSSPYGDYSAWFFNGSFGYVGYVFRDGDNSVRCARSAAW